MSRGGKSKNAYLPGDLVALGSKSTSRVEPNPQEKRGSNLLLHRKLMESSITDRKRAGPPLTTNIPTKKPKSHTGSNNSSFAWEQMCIDVDSIDFFDSISYASQNQENLKAMGLLFGVLKTMHTQKLKPDLFWGLLITARTYPTLFQNEEVINALCSIIACHSTVSTKQRQYNIISAVTSINLIMATHDKVTNWPEAFVKVFIEDSMGERLWVDNEDCKFFIDNIKVSIDTRLSPYIPLDFLDTMNAGESTPSLPEFNEVTVMPRYSTNQTSIEHLFIDVAKEYLVRRQSTEGISRNLLKLLSVAAGVLEVRSMVAGKLEVWLQNAKLVRPAQELLLAVCVNCTSRTQRDFDIISTIVKMRLKNKSIGNFYVSCIKELITASPANLPVIIKNVVYNEMSTSRNTSNMSILQVLFKAEPDQSALLLADIFQELLVLRDDYLRSLRVFLREIFRQVRTDFYFLTFCQGLMSSKELNSTSDVKERVFTGIVDLLTLCIFLTVYPYMRSERKDLAQFEKMQHAISKIQKDGVIWLHDNVIKIYRPSPTDFVHALHKILLMESPDQYYKLESWPPEQDRSTIFRIATEVPLLQGIVITILKMGLSKEHHLNSPDALELVDQLVKRAASLQVYHTINPIQADNYELFDILLSTCAYHHPEKIELPAGYTPPQLAISNLYWKTWLIMLIYCSHIPSVFGNLACRTYPMLRIFIEMCITNNFSFPNFLEDLQMQSVEKQKILEFESYLAAASTKVTITEQNSLLLSQLMGMDPLGPPRRPPQSILDQLRVMNTNLRIGHLLCRSRDPDFLLDIIQRQGTSQSMPWLADLVNSSEGSLNHLPVQCLCEFLLSPSCRQQGKFYQLLNHLKKLLMYPDTDPSISCEVLEYFLRRLSSSTSRQNAILGLKLLLNSADEKNIDIDKVIEAKTDVSWLLTSLPQLPNFPAFRSQIVMALRQACQVENDPHLITAYLTFLAERTSETNKGLTNEQLADMVLDMAQLIVERSTVMAAVLPVSTDTVTVFNVALNSLVNIFYSFLCRARQPCRQNHPWSENQDQILVTWPGGQECTLHILVVHAMIILLTYGPQCIQDPMKFDHLLEAWFPSDKKLVPKAYLVDTSEEALLIPDWLKLRMIRSRVPRLVEEALTDLEPPQLILFIQSFGIPVASMSKLLEILDKAVCHDAEAIKAAVMDKAYMVQLVQVQQRRGALGGQVFSSILTLNDEPMAVDIIEKTQSTKELKLNFKEEPFDVEDKSSTINSDSLLKKLYSYKKVNEEFMSLLQDTPSQAQHLIVVMLKKMLKNKEFVNVTVVNENISYHLLKVLMTKWGYNKILMAIVKLMISNIDNQKHTSMLHTLLTSYINKYDSNKRIIKKLKKNTTPDKMEIDVVIKTQRRSLFVDLQKEIELKIADLTIEQQVNMLFSKTVEDKWDSVRNCRPYLLTLLNHHMNWSSLECVLDILLDLNNVEMFEPSSVLDLISAITTNPKLWQGREMNLPKNKSTERLMFLNDDQVTSLLLYLIEECRLKHENPNISWQDLSTFMQTKLSVLLNHCMSKNNYTQIFHNIHLKYINSDNVKVFKQILSLVYANDPNIISKLQFYGMDKFLDPAIIKESEGCTLDSISHTVVSSIVSTKIKREKELNKKIYDYEILAKRLSTTHPILFLRVFELLSAPLQRCCYLEFKAMKSGHLLLLNNILDLVESLEPTVYLPFYKEAIHKLFEIFLTIICNNLNSVSPTRKEFNTLLAKFGNRIHSYISHNSQDAMVFIKSHIIWFSNLIEKYKNIGNLNLVISQNDKVIVLQPTNDTSNDIPYDKFFNCFKDYDTANNMLGEMERSVHRTNKILEPFLYKITTLIRNPSSNYRIPSFSLLLHYLNCRKTVLSTNTILLPAILTALISDDNEVSSTIRNKIDSLSMCKEMALPLLLESFKLGVNKSLNTTSMITKTISSMNLQSGC
ncbi:integrator complex subunit 1-like isoform X2 [Daktulosphaira vitifoliae]|uniref:integrator complex subunit 1-like isoform X2 n=1 Tax=Daktulosphaira vitifoliae TaxID=58002 RepID=UPI0021AA8F39|nr:integrator complex subunit 1-like isoform X2 [Daktulosphaira vitifoliae]